MKNFKVFDNKPEPSFKFKRIIDYNKNNSKKKASSTVSSNNLKKKTNLDNLNFYSNNLFDINFDLGFHFNKIEKSVGFENLSKDKLKSFYKQYIDSFNDFIFSSSASQGKSSLLINIKDSIFESLEEIKSLNYKINQIKYIHFKAYSHNFPKTIKKESDLLFFNLLIK